MESLIKFRSLVSQLRPAEHQQFIQEFIQSIDSDAFTTFLFRFFQENLNDELLSVVNESLSKTIRGRCSKKTELRALQSNGKMKSEWMHVFKSPSEPSPFLNRLPSSIIQKCASYLNASEYMRLSVCNRTMYISIQTSCTLTSLNLIKQKNYSRLNLHRFKSLEVLWVSMRHFNKLKCALLECGCPNPVQTYFPRLHTVHLDNGCSSEANFVQFGMCMDLTQITTLGIYKFGSITSRRGFDFDRFCWFLHTLFPNVLELKLSQIRLTAYNPQNPLIPTIFPKLKKITMLRSGQLLQFGRQFNDAGLSLVDTLLRTREIVSLTYNTRTHDCRQLQVIDTYLQQYLHRLQSLQIYYPSRLPKIDCTTRLQNLSFLCISSSLIKRQLTEILKHSPSLQYIELLTDVKWLRDMLQCVEKGLMKRRSDDDARKLTIRIVIVAKQQSADSTGAMEALIVSTLRIINVLSRSDLHDFRFVIDIPTRMDPDNHRFHLPQNYSSSYLVHYATFRIEDNDVDDYFRIAIANQQCKISGYRYLDLTDFA